MIPFLFITCLFVLFFTLLLIVDVAAIRWLRHNKASRLKAFIQKWTPAIQPYLHATIDRKPSLPTVNKNIDWLILWVNLGLSIHADVRKKLARLGKEIGLLELALSHLRGRVFENKLIALTAIGFLQDLSTWRLVIPLSYSSNLSLSIRSLETLMRLDSSQAAPFILENYPRRTDWPLPTLLNLLGGVSGTLISEYVREALSVTNPKMAYRLIPFLQLLHPKDRSALLLKQMTDSAQAQTLIECLKLISQPKETALARDIIAHGDWRVRAEAASTLGRCGNVLDKKLLEPLLCDPVWWVRYHSAKALFLIPGIKSKDLREIKLIHPDLFLKEASC